MRDVAFNPQGYQFHGFDDYSYYYVNWTKAWYEGDWYPYHWGDRLEDPLFNYSYPPLYLYFITLFWRPGMNTLWIAFPLILTDSLCAGMVYLIIKQFIKEDSSLSIALFGGFLMILAPLNIIYNGTYWLNPGPVTLITLIAIYFAIKKKWWQTFFWLGLATLTKQNALFLSYPLFLTMLGTKLSEKSTKKAIIESIMSGLLFVFILIVGSFPFVILSPKLYIFHNAIPGKALSLDSVIEEPYFKCINFAYALLQIGFGGIILDFFAFGVNSMLLFYLSSSLISLILLWRSYRNKLTNIGFVELITSYIILTHLFLPRGMFKFYTTYFTPFYLLAFLLSLVKMSKKDIILGINLTI